MNLSKPTLKRLVFEVGSLAWPAMVQGLLTTVVFFTDRLLLGRYHASALGSMQISGPVLWSAVTVFGAFGAGTMAVVGRAVGAKEPERARATVLSVCVLAFAGGVVVALGGWACRGMIAEALGGSGPDSEQIRRLAEDYMGVVFLGSPVIFLSIGAITSLQASGDTRTPAIITGLSGALNLVLSWILIFGHFGAPEMGVLGAAIGTVGAYISHSILGLLALFRRSGPVGRNWSMPPVLRTFVPVLKISWAALGERLIFHSGFLIFAAFIGRLGGVSMACNQSLIAIESLGFILASGFSIAGGALMAQKLGAGLPDEAEACAWISVVMAVFVLGAVGLLFWNFPEALIKFFTDDAEVLALGVDCLKIAAIAQPIMGICDALAGSLRGAGDTRSPMIVSLIGPLCIRLSLCWALAFPLGYGLTGIWIGTTVEWAVRAILLTVIFYRGRWRNIELSFDTV